MKYIHSYNLDSLYFSIQINTSMCNWNRYITLYLLNLLFENYMGQMYTFAMDTLFQVKSRKYQGVFEVKSRAKTWQVRGIWSQQLEH